jgi:hypothetical protein
MKVFHTMRYQISADRICMQNRKIADCAAPALAAAFCAGLFLYILLRIEPALYTIAQEPVFQANYRFFSEYLSYPGGMADYSAAFLMQFFLHPAAGSLIITGLLFAICCGTLLMLNTVGGHRSWYSTHLVPAALCMPLLCNYHHPLAVTVAYASAIWWFVLFVLFRKYQAVLRIPVFVIMAGTLYLYAGGAMLLFAALCVLFEAALRRSYVAAAAFGTLAAAIPLFCGKYLFLISLRDAFFHLLPFGIAGYNPPVMAAAPYALLPALLFLPAVLGVLKSRSEKAHTFSRAAVAAVPVLILGATLAVAAAVSFNQADHNALRLYLLTRNGDWDGIVKEVRKSRLDNRISNFAINRALGGTGRLSTDLFAWPQKFGDRALFLFGPPVPPFGPPDLDAFNFSCRCDLFFDLGLVNEAEQWGYESLTIRGETALVLKRLAQIHAVKGELAAGRACLAVLETIPGYSSWARAFRHKMADSSALAADSALLVVRSSMPTADYIRNSFRQPVFDLAKAISQNPRNRMAFEYCMASFLLQGNLRGIAWLAGRMPQFYPDVPRLYGEALAIMKAAGVSGLPAAADRIDRKTIEDYMAFNQILQNHGGDYRAAEKEILDNFPDSYWYYFFYRLRQKGAQQ